MTELRIANFELRKPMTELRIANCEFRKPMTELRIAELRELCLSACFIYFGSAMGWRIANCELRIANCENQGEAKRIRIWDCGLRKSSVSFGVLHLFRLGNGMGNCELRGSRWFSKFAIRNSKCPPLRFRNPQSEIRNVVVVVVRVAPKCYQIAMVKEVTLRKAGRSIGATLPKDMADRLHLAAGDRVLAVESDRGILLTPYDPAVERALAIARRVAKKYWNALRELAK